MLLILIVFSGKPQSKAIQPVPMSMQVPLVILALCSIVVGLILASPITSPTSLGPWVQLNKIAVPTLLHLHEHILVELFEHIPYSMSFWLSVIGAYVAIRTPQQISNMLSRSFGGIFKHGYGFDGLVVAIVKLFRCLASLLARLDQAIFDHIMVIGSGKLVIMLGRYLQRRVQYQLHENIFMVLLGFIVMYMAARLMV